MPTRQFVSHLVIAMFIVSSLGYCPATSATEPQTINLWPAKAPGEVQELPPEEVTRKPDGKPVSEQRITSITNVSVPTLSLYQAKGDGPHTAIVVCPGGGHRNLAFDHEGIAIAEWLNSIGITAVVLKYRVPARNPDFRAEAAVQDAQRTMGLVRSKAVEWKIDSTKIGILGFSAGGETAALTSIMHAKRLYPAIDSADEISCRPDFAALVYSGGLTVTDKPWELKPHVKVDESTPPMFLVHSTDDRVPVSNSLLLFAEMKKANRPAELHAYATGGHGYGIRRSGHPANEWPKRFEEWMRHQSFWKSE